jgi:hypothetical protein
VRPSVALDYETAEKDYRRGVTAAVAAHWTCTAHPSTITRAKDVEIELHTSDSMGSALILQGDLSLRISIKGATRSHFVRIRILYSKGYKEMGTRLGQRFWSFRWPSAANELRTPRVMGILTARGEMEERTRAPHSTPKVKFFSTPF